MKVHPLAVLAKCGVTLLIVGSFAAYAPRITAAQPPAYHFTHIATLGDAAPGGGTFINDFEPWSINSSGDVAFAADLDTGGEGIFISRKGQISEIMRSGQPAPGGGTFSGGVLTYSPINDKGDVAFAFTLGDFPLAGVYHFTRATGSLSAVMVPGVTLVPGSSESFQGASENASLNNGSTIAFAGVISTTKGLPTDSGLGVGVFEANRFGYISNVVSPGDQAPGGGQFDIAFHPWVNARGDIAFGGHVKGEECIIQRPLFCAESVYVKKASSGQIISIAHQGGPAPVPGGGTYRFAFGPILNNVGDIVFIGGLSAKSDDGEDLGVFFYSAAARRTEAVALPGDPMPGGGTLLTAPFFRLNFDVSNRSNAVAFAGVLDTKTNGTDNDTGLYVLSTGGLHLVARTGTVIPGIGTITALTVTAPGFPTPWSGGAINERGQIAFAATLTDGSTVLLLATPG
jgi:hypothetical protein